MAPTAPADPITIAIEPACGPLADGHDLHELVAYALASEGVQAAGALTVVLVDDAQIHDLNRRFLGHDEPTDVITFALGGGRDDGFIDPGDGVQEFGEIYVSCERAAAQSGEWGSNPEREVQFLVVHGLLHLLGWDDATPPARARMLARGAEILAGWASERGATR